MNDSTSTPLVPPAVLSTLLGAPEPPSEPSPRTCVTLWTGRKWPFACPTVADVHAGDWHSLAFVPRYGGAAGAYSVMEHLVRGVRQARHLGLHERIVLAYAVHDIPECYPPADMLGPVVRELQRVEAATGVPDPTLRMRAAAEEAVWAKCGVADIFREPASAALVHRLDVAMCAAEKRSLVRGNEALVLPEWAPTERIRPMDPAVVLLRYHAILKRFAPALGREFEDGWAA